MTKEYYLGLDMGTSSLGWAVTDTNYNLMRAKGKDLWGVRLFSEAKTSAQRRGFRTARRRRQRKKLRIGYLRELFADEINKVDPGFYQRLDDSKYFMEDKKERQPFALFADTGYTDKEYYEEYPTIFHLRKELIESKEKHDVRLVYLALLNMFKHRGHFLNANLNEDGIGNLEEFVTELSEELSNYLDIEISSDLFTEILTDVLPSKKFSNSKKVEEILSRANLVKSKNTSLTEIIKLICGLKGKLAVVFKNDEFDEEGKKFSISYRDGNFDENNLEAEELLSDEAYEIFMLIKQIHDWGVLSNIMIGDDKTYEYLSLARVDSYEKHGTDLKVLKALYKKFSPEKYAAMFRVMEENNYSAYVGSVNSGKEVKRRGAKVNETQFFNKIKKDIADMPDCDEKTYVLSEIEKETFLPKQLNASNGVIPHQVHKAELKAILSNAENYLEFLKAKDDTGLSVSEKIIKLFDFHIPYYIGPLFDNKRGNAWVERKEMGRVLPWNFEQKINTKVSAEKFIDRMVKHCTYLSGETVLPKNSLLYEKFCVLNELNNLKINGEAISVDLKQNIYSNLFKKGKKVKKSHIDNYLKTNGIIEKSDDADMTGIDGDVKNTLSSYAKFSAVFGVENLTYQQEQMSEKIIFWSTVYGDSKKFLKERIEEVYGNILSQEQIKRILGFKFQDWGRFSKALLELEGADKETGEVQTILSRMWNENYNLMELLSGKFTYLNAIESKSKKIDKTLSEIEYEDLADLYISASVKRMVWQTMLVMKELYKVLGCAPKRIFVEMARDAETKKERKESRKKKFEELYKNCRDDGRAWKKEISDTDESKFRSKKLYLYYTQKGRCMYTGEQINLYDLFNDNLYDIDHIYPRHFVKDDSIENNLVLVKKETNAHKSDVYPLENGIRTARYSWWKSLKDGGFITEEKYKRLTRNYEFTPEEQAAFINRQIVETRQGTKVITNLFKNTFDSSEIVYVKAGNVSTFRQKFDLIKCRDVNDYHHANDAYLNIVVGNVYYVKFTRSPINFIKEYRKNPQKNQYHMYRIFDYKVQRNDEIAWETEHNVSINTVQTVMRRNTPLVTRMNYEEHGGLADQTIYSADKAAQANGVGYIPVKSSDKALNNTCRYGGFTKYTGTYFFLVEHMQKGKKLRTIEAVPLYMKDRLNTVAEMEQYCKDVLGYDNPKVRLKKIKMYSLIKVNGFYLYLTGRSNAQLCVSNAVELCMDYKDEIYIKRILGAIERKTKTEDLLIDGITPQENLKLYDKFTNKYSVSIYANRQNPIGDKFKNGKEKFKALDVKKQLYVLIQILQLSKHENNGADLRNIGCVQNTGKMTLNKKISNYKEFKLINQSVTGLFEETVDLLTV